MVKRTIITLSVVTIVALSFTACSSNKDESAANQTDQHQNMNGNMNHDQMATNENMDGTSNHDHMAMEGVEKKAGEKLIYYTCPMPAHKAVHSDQPGKCPECSMTLVEAVVTDTTDMQFWGCPMPTHSHVRLEKSGDCPECGMKLKPMRLVKN